SNYSRQCRQAEGPAVATKNPRRERKRTMKTNETDKNAASRVARRAKKTTLCPILRLLLIAALLSPAKPVLGGAVDLGGRRHVDTMTINLYVGGGTGRVLALNPADPGYL